MVLWFEKNSGSKKVLRKKKPVQAGRVTRWTPIMTSYLGKRRIARKTLPQPWIT